MADVVASATYRGCMERAAADGDAVRLAGTGVPGPESQVHPELQLAGAP
jgi:hypothetical protein